MLTSAVVITTKNRKDELKVALHSALQQEIVDEIIVIDDGSEDGTYEMVQDSFPSVALYRNNASIGYIASRNLAARIATADIIFSIDDDAEFSAPDIIRSILPFFEVDEFIAAVAIPYREPYKENIILQKPPVSNGLWETWGFIGTAHAVRRSLFIHLGGYDEALIHQGEETDYALLCINNGYSIVLGRSNEILHYESPKRDSLRMAYYGPRNLIYTLYKYCPSILLLPALTYYVACLFLYSARIAGNARCQYFKGIIDGLFSFRLLKNRSALSLAAYFRFLRLRKRPALRS
jgi:GT2 family glycosyltransferase